MLTEEEEKEMLKAPGQVFFTLYPGSHPKIDPREVIDTRQKFLKALEEHEVTEQKIVRFV